MWVVNIKIRFSQFIHNFITYIDFRLTSNNMVQSYCWHSQLEFSKNMKKLYRRNLPDMSKEIHCSSVHFKEHPTAIFY